MAKRGLSAAKPTLKSAIEAAFNQYRDAGMDKNNNPVANTDALANAIANAVFDFVSDARVQADIGAMNIVSLHYHAPPGILGGPLVPISGGGPVLTATGDGKLT